MELLTTFPPRPITNEAEAVATQARINSLLDKSPLTQDDRNYLKILGMLVYEYEEVHEPMPKLQGIDLLKALMADSDLQPQDLAAVLGNETVVLEILDRQRPLTDQQLQDDHEKATFLQEHQGN
jgi:HTH-type transcriptional regulator/antitoxin HigA